MSKRMDQLMAAQEKATQKRHDAQREEKRFKKQISDLKGNERTRHLCTCGGYLEKLLQEPEAFTDDEVLTFLDYAFGPPCQRSPESAFGRKTQ